MSRSGAPVWCRLLAIAPLLASAPVVGQKPNPPDSVRAPTLATTFGIGSTLGWLGVRVERYLFEGAFSIGVAGGYVPMEDPRPSFAAFAGVARRYLRWSAHSAAIELSYSMTHFESTTQAGALLDRTEEYGPGVTVAYRYTTRDGFHVDVSGGVGWRVTGRGDGAPTSIGSLGLGYTWR